MTKAIAIIKWIQRKNGDNRYWPPTDKYYSIARFVNDKSDWPNTCWTLMAKCQSSQDDGWTWQAEIWFPAKNAPVHYLTQGNRFDFLEIWDTVGEGIIVAVPSGPTHI